jgi:hypothetical protein
MPQVRKLGPEEVQVLKNKGKGQRKLVEEQYDAILSEYDVGDYGEAVLEYNEKRLTVRNRLRAAAERRNLGIEFKRTTGDLLRFQIQAHNGAQRTSAALAAPEPTPQPTKRKGGRPRKAG